jgi:purine-binding chemotaxis protein CheW
MERAPEAVTGLLSGAWGGISLGGMTLALPLDVLREVLPWREPVRLPCPAPGVLGGLPLRGVTVPVLDLMSLLGRPEPDQQTPCVVLVVHEGRMLGLRCHGVCGIFHAEPGSLVPTRTDGQASAATHLFAGSLRRADGQGMLTVLSIDALARLPDVPWIDDPEPARQTHAVRHDDPSQTAQPDQARRSLMLLVCGGMALAVDSVEVRATLWEPALLRSPLTGGNCRGVLVYEGRHIAAVDLLAHCGLGETSDAGPRQALVIACAQGDLALLVDRVAEILPLEASAICPLPAQAVGDGAVCQGIVSGSALPAAHARDHLLLDLEAIRQHPAMAGLASAHTPASDRGPSASAAASGVVATGRPLITFRAPHEVAVPIDQVREILPFGCAPSMFGDESVLRRVQVLRGRSLPVLCLARLGGSLPGTVDASAAILVVEHGGHLLGYAVPMLGSIERAHWERGLPGPAAPSQDAHALWGGRQVAGIGSAAAPRSVPVLDLWSMTERLASRQGWNRPAV